jgi:thiamine pyrophosphate-dependent acetolactate synthase large subunit-like protein/nitrite reductase/ring-hydroxylating ferredoxin subunit
MTWHKAIDIGDLPEGRVTTVSIGSTTLAVSHVGDRYGAIDNHCPHQGGPLGEGSIEPGVEDNCWLRCPWHGYDYDPITGQSPGAHGDGVPSHATEIRGAELWVDLPDLEATERTVSDVLVETMVNWGVDSVFGMVGHSNLGFADAMRRAEDRGELRYFGIRHEGAAAFAATAYGKLTGSLAACFAIAGPGSTNLLTGLYDAKVDRSPVLALSGQVATAQRGRGAFQDVDLESAFDDVSGFSESVHAGADPAELMTLACKTAIVDQRVGHLVLPDDAQTLPSDGPAGGPEGRSGARAIAPPVDALDEAARRIAAGERPMIVVGAGVRHEMAPIIELAEHLGAPVTTTFKAKGQIGDDHELGCGVLGRSGTPIASWFMNESDLLIVFGASFSNHTGIAPYKPIIQIDEDPMALGRFHPVDVAVQGNGAVTARLLQDAITDRRCIDHRAEVAERWAIWRAEKASRRTDDHGAGINAAALFEALGDAAPDDAVLCVDVGNNTYSFGRYFESQQGQSVLMSGYLGSIGFAFPAAMGAWAAVGANRKVISVSGDGGFGQYAMELTTAAKYGMDITHVLLNNSELGKISKEQRAAEFDVWQTSLVNPDFAAMAELCGATGFRVTDASHLASVLADAIRVDGPALVEVVTDASLV